MKLLAWIVSAFTAFAFTALFVGVFSMAHAAHQVQQAAPMVGRLAVELVIAEEAQRAHLRADSARVAAVNRMTP